MFVHGRRRHAVFLKQRGVAGDYGVAVYFADHAAARELRYRRALGCELRSRGFGYRARHGMRRAALSEPCGREQLLARHAIGGRDVRDAEAPVGQRSGLVEDGALDLAERVEDVRALDEYAVLRGRADAAEVAERYRNYERAGARDDEQHEAAVYGLVPVRAAREARGDHNRRCGEEYRGRVPFREFRDEALRRSFALHGVLYHFEHTRDSGVLERPRRLDEQQSVERERAAVYLRAGADRHGHRLARYRGAVELRLAADYYAVDRDYLAGQNLHDVAFLYLLRLFFYRLAVSDEARRHGLLREQRLYRAARVRGRALLEGLAEAVEEHDADRLASLAYREGRERRAAHQREFVEEVAAQQRAEGGPQHGPARYDVEDGENRVQQRVRAFVVEQVQLLDRECGEEYRARHGEEGYLAAELRARAPLVLLRLLKYALRGVARGAAAAVVVAVRVMMLVAATAFIVVVMMLVAAVVRVSVSVLVRMVVTAAAGFAMLVLVMMLMLPAAAFMRVSMLAVSAVLMLASLSVFARMSAAAGTSFLVFVFMLVFVFVAHD